MYPSEALHNVYSEVKNASSSAVESQLYNTQPIPVSLKLAIRVSKLFRLSLQVFSSQRKTYQYCVPSSSISDFSGHDLKHCQSQSAGRANMMT